MKLKKTSLIILVVCVFFAPLVLGASQSTTVVVSTIGGLCTAFTPSNTVSLSCGGNQSQNLVVTHTYNTTNVTYTIVEELDYDKIGMVLNGTLGCPEVQEVKVQNLSPLLDGNVNDIKEAVMGNVSAYLNLKLTPKQDEIELALSEKEKAEQALYQNTLSLNDTRRSLELERFKLNSCEDDRDTMTWVLVAAFVLFFGAVGFIIYGGKFGKKGEMPK